MVKISFLTAELVFAAIWLLTRLVVWIRQGRISWKREVYYNTKRAIPVEPDESVIVNEELPLNGSISDEKITAYAFINDEKLGEFLVCLIDGEWYQFVETDRVGQP